MEEELEVDIQHKEEEEWEREETKCRAMRSRCSAVFTQAGGRPVLLCPKCICATHCAPDACASMQGECRGDPMHTWEDPAESSMVAAPTHPPLLLTVYSPLQNFTLSKTFSPCPTGVHTLLLLSYPPLLHPSNSYSSIILFLSNLLPLLLPILPPYFFQNLPNSSFSPFPPPLLQYPSPPNSTTRWFVYGGRRAGETIADSLCSLPHPHPLLPTITAYTLHCKASKSQRCSVVRTISLSYERSPCAAVQGCPLITYECSPPQTNP